MLLRPSVRRWYDNPFYCPDLSPQKEKMPTPRGRLGRAGTRGMRGTRGTRSLFGKSSAKTFLKDFCLRKGGSVNKVLSVYNKTAYFNEKNRRTASPPTVFVVYRLPCAEMKTDCQRGVEEMFAENRMPQMCG